MSQVTQLIIVIEPEVNSGHSDSTAHDFDHYTHPSMYRERPNAEIGEGQLVNGLALGLYMSHILFCSYNPLKCTECHWAVHLMVKIVNSSMYILPQYFKKCRKLL